MKTFSGLRSRRAMERKEARKAQKQARQEALSSTVAADDYITAERESLLAERAAVSAALAQLQANRRNAALSTGPKTPEGKYHLLA